MVEGTAVCRVDMKFIRAADIFADDDPDCPEPRKGLTDVWFHVFEKHVIMTAANGYAMCRVKASYGSMRHGEVVPGFAASAKRLLSLPEGVGSLTFYVSNDGAVSASPDQDRPGAYYIGNSGGKMPGFAGAVKKAEEERKFVVAGLEQSWKAVNGQFVRLALDACELLFGNRYVLTWIGNGEKGLWQFKCMSDHGDGRASFWASVMPMHDIYGAQNVRQDWLLEGLGG